MSAAHDTTRHQASAGVSRQPALLRREHGFMLVEALIAMVVFAIVATGVVDMLVSSTSITTLAKQRTLAEQGVSNQIEYVRSVDYASLGTVGGNPSGTIPESQVFDGVNNETLGVPATMSTEISYASANVPGSALTGADEKQVTVTITRTSDSKVLAQAVTYVAPKKQSSQTTAAVEATVTDIGNNQSQSGTVLDNVNVTLTPPVGLSPAIPSGPESDTTDASGTVSFAGLTPTSGSQLYTVGIASTDLPAFYTQLPAAGFPLSPTQVQPESIQVYQPVTLYVALKKVDGTNWVGHGEHHRHRRLRRDVVHVQQRAVHGRGHAVRDHDPLAAERSAAAPEHRLLHLGPGERLQRRDRRRGGACRGHLSCDLGGCADRHVHRDDAAAHAAGR